MDNKKDAYFQILIHPDHQNLLTEREDLHVSMPTLWSISSTKGIYKTAEASGGLPEIKWLSPHNILGRHANATPGQGPTTTGNPTHLPIIGKLRVNGEPKKSLLTPTQELEILGFHLSSVTTRLSTPLEKLRKIQQDARHLLDRESVSVREIARFVGKPEEPSNWPHCTTELSNY